MQHQALKIADCTSDQDCIDYPSFPYCDIQGSGHCVSNSNYLIISEGDTFDKNDMCKKYYGDIYVFDVEVNACRVPKCSVEKDYCPKPSKCWRGIVWTVNDVLSWSIPGMDWLKSKGMDQLNKRVWINSRRHWRSTVYYLNNQAEFVLFFLRKKCYLFMKLLALKSIDPTNFITIPPVLNSLKRSAKYANLTWQRLSLTFLKIFFCSYLVLATVFTTLHSLA